MVRAGNRPRDIHANVFITGKSQRSMHRERLHPRAVHESGTPDAMHFPRDLLAPGAVHVMALPILHPQQG
jgi:hypothetical protein